jgi:hypothetical protein
MKDAALAEQVCLRFCTYFKNGKNEELTCMGFRVVQKLLSGGIDIPFHCIGNRANPSTEEILVSCLCVVCPFFENDCDFAASRTGTLNSLPFTATRKVDGDSSCPVEKESPPPCGGFIVLGHLLNNSIITDKDIRNGLL